MHKKLVLVFVAMMMFPLISFSVNITRATDPYIVGLWHFDEGSGITAYDSSTYMNDGTINGAIYVAGKSGTALSFDGTDDYVSVPDSSSLDLTEITVEAWVKVLVLKNYDAIVIKGYDGEENCEALSYSNGMVHCPIKFTDGTRAWLNSPGGAIQLNVWHHVAMTYKPGEWRIYVDGYLVAQRTDISKMPQTNDRPLIIGAEESSSGGFMSGRFFSGVIDEVKICNVALSAFKIAQDAGLTVMPPATGIFGIVIDAYQDPSAIARTWVWTGYNPSVISYSYSWTTPNPDPDAGNYLDLRWVNPVGTNSYVTWDMGQQVLGIRVYPTQDHLGWDITTGQPNNDPDNPNDFEYHEYVVYASNDMMTWIGPIPHSAFWLEGWVWEPNAIADDAVKDYSFGGVAYRYIKIVPLYDEQAADADYEIDAVEALELPPPEIIIHVDIKPGSWPNPINIMSGGVFAVAICGTEDFDVTTIDPSTVKIYIEGTEGGVSPLRWSYEDVATPYIGELGSGHALDGDGYLDLVFHFETREVAGTLDLREHIGETIPLIIKGNLYEEYDGTPIMGQDYVRIQEPSFFRRLRML